jgi:hypothetical protein
MPIQERKIDNMPIKRLYVCDFCDNETVAPTENWHRLADCGAGSSVPQAIIILCNVCKDHLIARKEQKQNG